MKKGISILLTLILLSILAGCSNSTKVDKIGSEPNTTNVKETSPEPLINEFISKLYTVDDYKSIDLDNVNSKYPNDKYTNELKKLAEENVLVPLVNDRTQLMYLTTCKNSHINIKIMSTKVDKYITEKDGAVVYNYNAKLQLTFPDDNKQVEENINGQLTLNKASGKWIITQVNKIDDSITQKYRKK